MSRNPLQPKTPYIVADSLPDNPRDAAHWWYEFGFNVAPLDPGTKHTRVRWAPWLETLQASGHEAINKEWRDTDLVCMITDSRLLVLDADSPESLSALYQLEKSFDITPNLVASTTRGEHHFFSKHPTETYAQNRGYNTEGARHKIDVRTGRSLVDGRGIIALPPDKQRRINTNEAKSIDDLVEVGQDFIDAVFHHNGEEPPRQRDHTPRTPSESSCNEREIAEILSFINPSCGYGDWLNVLMGVHHKTGGSNEGLIIVDAWSSRGDNYCGFEEIEYKWKTFSIVEKLTFATVCDMARRNGADLADISRRHREANNSILFERLRAVAQELAPESPPAEIKQLMQDAKPLDPIRQRQLQEATKRQTGIPLGVLRKTMEVSNDEEGLDHLDLAQRMVADIGTVNVLCDGVQTWRWADNGVWKILEDRAVKSIAHRVIPSLVEKVTKSTVDSVIDLFKTEILKEGHIFNQGNPEAVNCTNGEIHLIDGSWRLQPHRRENYRTTQIPVAYSPDATAPRFEQFLAEVFDGDPDTDQKQAAVMEMMGYSLMAHCRQEKFAMLIGSGANGKSVLLTILEALCGTENIAGVQPSKFGNPFQRAYLEGKLANIVTEIRQGEVIEDAALKGIVSGEPATVEKKHKDPFTLRPFATCWFATNHMPHTRDFSDGLFRRALILTFNNRFKPEDGNCDPLLTQKLLGELPGILNLVLKAYSRGLSSGFTSPASSQDALRAWRLEADQVAQFVEHNCIADPYARVPSRDLYFAYQNFATQEGIKNTVGHRCFTTRLKTLGFETAKSGGERQIKGLRRRELGDQPET